MFKKYIPPINPTRGIVQHIKNNRDFLIDLVLAVIIALSSYGSWTIISFVFLPALFFRQKSVPLAAVFILTFYLILNGEEIKGAEHFWQINEFYAIALWFAHALLLSLPWLVFYKKNLSPTNLSARITLMSVLFAIPPLGLFIWLQPIIASGALYPGLGFTGLGLTLLLMVLLAVLERITHKSQKNIALSIILILIALALMSNLRVSTINTDANTSTSITAAPKITAINTHFGGSPKSPFEQAKREQRLAELTKQAIKQGAELIVMPENMTQESSGSHALWQQLTKTLSQNTTIIIGSERNINDQIESGVHLYTKHESLFLPQIMPMIAGEWLPWGRYLAHPFAREKFNITSNNKTFTVSFLICYEQLIPWPMLYALATAPKPQLIIGLANQWFAAPKSYHKQQLSMQMLARLFGVKTVNATNWATPRVATHLTTRGRHASRQVNRHFGLPNK